MSKSFQKNLDRAFFGNNGKILALAVLFFSLAWGLKLVL